MSRFSIRPSAACSRERSRTAASPAQSGASSAGDSVHGAPIASTSVVEPRTPVHERPRAHVASLVFEQVVREQACRRVPQHRRRQLVPADAALQHAERQRALAVERHDLAVDHRAVGQAGCRQMQLGKALRDELLAARPDERLASAADHLRANAVPFPLGEPLLPRSEVCRGTVERRRQVEGVGPRAIDGNGVGRRAAIDRSQRTAAIAPSADGRWPRAARRPPPRARGRRACAIRRRGTPPSAASSAGIAAADRERATTRRRRAPARPLTRCAAAGCGPRSRWTGEHREPPRPRT